MEPDPDDSNLLEKKATKIIQYIVGKMLYYSQSVGTTMLQAIMKYRESNQIQQGKSRKRKECY